MRQRLNRRGHGGCGGCGGEQSAVSLLAAGCVGAGWMGMDGAMCARTACIMQRDATRGRIRETCADCYAFHSETTCPLICRPVYCGGPRPRGRAHHIQEWQVSLCGARRFTSTASLVSLVSLAYAALLVSRRARSRSARCCLSLAPSRCEPCPPPA